jgi:hypothetical protein
MRPSGGGGSLYNSGSISGGIGVHTDLSASVRNVGTIGGANIGVELRHGGYVGNS